MLSPSNCRRFSLNNIKNALQLMTCCRPMPISSGMHVLQAVKTITTTTRIFQLQSTRATSLLACPFVITRRGMANQRHKKMIKKAKGFLGRANRCFKIAKLKVQKGMQYTYRARRVSPLSLSPFSCFICVSFHFSLILFPFCVLDLFVYLII